MHTWEDMLDKLPYKKVIYESGRFIFIELNKQEIFNEKLNNNNEP